MANRPPIALEEWYHCFNRGVDKRRVFHSKSDYERFMLLMYVGNSSVPLHISNMKNRGLKDILMDASLRGSPIVEIGSYALMPNHFHFVLKEIVEDGIALFMQKVFTGYTMYFNKKNVRTGALFAGTYKSKHVADDLYLKQVLSYIHLNPLALFDAEWSKHRGDRSLQRALENYQYSSLPDFIGNTRPQRNILGTSIFELFEKIPSISDMMTEALAYEDTTNIKVKP